MQEKKMHTISWDAYEYEYKHKGRDWFWGVGIITTALAVSSVVLGNITFAGVIVASAIVLTLYAIRRPRRITFTISKNGIAIENKKHSFGTLRSFWIQENESGIHKLIIQEARLLSPYLVIPLENIDAEEVRALLLSFLPEKEHHEPFSYKLMEQLGF